MRLMVFAAALLGLACGYCASVISFRDLIVRYEQDQTIGRVVQRLEEASTAYHNPASILATRDQISWDIAPVLSPFLGGAPAPGVFGNTHINKLQLRDERELILPKRTGVRRIIITGGSTAFGSGAPDDSSIIGRLLERELKNSEVYTFASPGWSSTHERIAIENRISEWEPDHVISLTGANDIYFASLGENVLWYRTLAEKFLFTLLNRGYDAAWRASPYDPVRRGSQPISCSEVSRIFTKNIALSSKALEMVGSKYSIALQPTLFTTNKPLSSRERALVKDQLKSYFLECFEGLAAAIKKTNLTPVDLRSAFDSLNAEDQIFIDSFHFGDRGNGILAQNLAKQL